jgi:hypothetical protein
MFAIDYEMRIISWSPGACMNHGVIVFTAPHTSVIYCVHRLLAPSSTGMSVSVPLITDPRDQLLGDLPFVHARARNQCTNAIRRAFDDTTGGQESVQVMLQLVTRNGPTLMEMVANVVRNESELLVILVGREVDCSLAGLIRPATESGSMISSVTTPSGLGDGVGPEADREATMLCICDTKPPLLERSRDVASARNRSSAPACDMAA